MIRRSSRPISAGWQRHDGMIEVERINTYYGDSHVLFDLSMEVREREVVALLGRNGAGKSTTLKTLAGVLQPRSGTIRFEGKPIQLLASHKIAGLGLQLVPEERRIFGTLSVEENLDLAALSARTPCRSTTFSRFFRGCGSGAAAMAGRFPAASSRCSRSRAP